MVSERNLHILLKMAKMGQNISAIQEQNDLVSADGKPSLYEVNNKHHGNESNQNSSVHTLTSLLP
jgi:hypothetical protein